MAMVPQSPIANAPCPLAVELEPAIPMEAAAATEPPAPATELVMIREQDRLMPIANVVRVMRRGLPPHAKISDDAKDVIQECVSEFISFVTGEANDRCHGEHRKTVTAEDVVWAMERLGFDDYLAPIKAYVRRMRDYDGAGRGGGDNAQTRVHVHHAPAPPLPMAAPHGVQVQAPPVAFPNSALAAHRYGAVPLQVQFGAAPRFGAQRNVLGGERSVAAAYHGAPTIGAEETSSSTVEQPTADAAPRRLHYPN